MPIAPTATLADSEATRGALPDAAELLAALREVRAHVDAEGRRLFAAWRPSIRRRAFLASALNLAHYLALRQLDLCDLQAALVPLGLSSLGRSEAHVVPTLDAVIATLAAMRGAGGEGTAVRRPPLRAFLRGQRRLLANTDELLGSIHGERRIRIMVTLPSEASEHYAVVRELVASGMDCARINCAHDGAEAWLRMIGHVRQAAAECGRACRVLMELGGPRVRTAQVLVPSAESRVLAGDRILLAAGEPSADAGIAFQASCSLPGVVARLRAGQRAWIDDGRIGCEVESVVPAGAILRVVQVRPKGRRLGAEQGLNFPDTDLGLGPLTDQDRHDLDVVAAHADAIGYSFVGGAEDIRELQRELRRRLPAGASLPPLVLKIETERAVARLPSLIVQAAGRQPLGVMIARGDLAVEIGYERLAEVQEEILWLCQAAHIPVIWATQVLERLVKKGIPSRAEITDAAMAERAECVMLNKGPFVAQGVTVLARVLTRMQSHQRKKMPLLHALRLWDSAESTDGVLDWTGTFRAVPSAEPCRVAERDAPLDTLSASA